MGISGPSPNSLWKIKFNKDLASYSITSIRLQHIKSNKLLGIKRGLNHHCGYYYHKSPSTNHTEGNIH